MNIIEMKLESNCHGLIEKIFPFIELPDTVLRVELEIDVLHRFTGFFSRIFQQVNISSKNFPILPLLLAFFKLPGL